MNLNREDLNDMTVVNPVLLAGGSGTRLWPLSRKSYPKQFSKLNAAKSLFQSSALRLISSEIMEFRPHLTLTSQDFRFIIGEQFNEVKIDPGPILIEPMAKNTAASVLAASIFCNSKDPDAVLLVAPSDHVIPDVQDFHEAISLGLSSVQNGKMVTFGIKPTRAETGYGYLELSTNNLDHSSVYDVIKFVEKPDLLHAQQMLGAGNFFWNAGIFLFSAKDMIEAFEVHAPKTLELVSSAVELSSPDLGFVRLAPEPWSRLENVSIDYAIMEKTQNLVAITYLSKWTDLGGWDAVWSESSHDASGNATSDQRMQLTVPIPCCVVRVQVSK